MNRERISHFFDFAALREEVRLKKEAGAPKPWTDDPVLQQFYFCNVFREDDTVTKWFAQNVRSLVQCPQQAVVACAAFRMVNRIPSAQAIKHLLTGSWSSKAALEILRRQKPVVGGAYIVKTPDGKDKAEGVVEVVDGVVERLSVMPWGSRSMQDWHFSLMECPFIGPFMAYEIVTDLTHTIVLPYPEDLMTWANPGPGCLRGLSWLHRGSPEVQPCDRHSAQEDMRELLEYSVVEWPWPERPWTMREVEHVLCEYGKFRAGHAGGSLKRRYNGAS